MSENDSNEAKQSIAEKIAALDSKIDWFYGDDFELDKAAEKYKEALALAKDAEKDLTDLKNEIEVLTENFTQAQ